MKRSKREVLIRDARALMGSRDLPSWGLRMIHLLSEDLEKTMKESGRWKALAKGLWMPPDKATASLLKQNRELRAALQELLEKQQRRTG